MTRSQRAVLARLGAYYREVARHEPHTPGMYAEGAELLLRLIRQRRPTKGD